MEHKSLFKRSRSLIKTKMYGSFFFQGALFQLYVKPLYAIVGSEGTCLKLLNRNVKTGNSVTNRVDNCLWVVCRWEGGG